MKIKVKYAHFNSTSFIVGVFICRGLFRQTLYDEKIFKKSKRGLLQAENWTKKVLGEIKIMLTSSKDKEFVLPANKEYYWCGGKQ